MTPDWQTMFEPQHLIELVIRGSLMYLGLFTLLRVLIRRRMGSLAATDLLVIVLIADAAQNGMADDYESIPDGIVLCAVIVLWATGLDWLGYRVPAIHKLLEPEPLCLVIDGKVQHKNLKKELLTIEELYTQLRQHGVKNLREVSAAFLEPDGKMSVLREHETSEEEDDDALSTSPQKAAGAK
jgi:uncharacterized membrane protein YcaP (DUF421 family)